jgi:hypothetical protein
VVLNMKDIVVMNNEVSAVRVNGLASPFKNNNFKILEDSAIVTVFGYGDGEKSQPDAIVGFASPLGWCNAKTRCGDCTSPVLDLNGNIVGFWTHGDGINFGRFEPINEEFIARAKVLGGPVHSGLDFRCTPLSQRI